MKKLIVAGSLAAGLAALAAWRMSQQKKNEDTTIPEEFTYTPPPAAPKDEPVGV